MPADFRLTETRQPPLKDQYDEWLARVMASIDRLFQAFGSSALIEAYLSAPEWNDIVVNALHCLQTLRTKDMKPPHTKERHEAS